MKPRAKDGNETVSASTTAQDKGFKARLRFKTASYPLVKSLDEPAAPPAPAALEAKPGVAVTIGQALLRLKDALAPASVLAALGLPAGSTNAEAIAANLIAKASGPECDAATIKALLERLETAEPQREVIVRVDYGNMRRKLLEEDDLCAVGNPGALRAVWFRVTEQQLAAEGDGAALAAWRGMTPALREELWAEIRVGLRSLTEGDTSAETLVQ